MSRTAAAPSGAAVEAHRGRIVRVCPSGQELSAPAPGLHEALAAVRAVLAGDRLARAVRPLAPSLWGPP